MGKNPAARMTRAEFEEAGFAVRGHASLAELRAKDDRAVPCGCDDFRCPGWRWATEAEPVAVRDGDEFVELGGACKPLDIAVETVDDKRSRFEKLAREWVDGTEFFSSSSAMQQHPAYAELLAMDKEIVPWVLDLYERGAEHGHWWLLLADLTGEIPGIRPEDAGKMAEVRRAWLRWGGRLP